MPYYELLNPNQEEHYQNYKKWKEQYGDGMPYYYNEVLPRCEAGILLPFPEGTFGAGVGGEAKWFLDNKLQTYIIELDGVIKLQNIDKSKILNVADTIDRVYNYDYFGIKKENKK